MIKKRMLENRDGKWFVNNSSLDLISQCSRKAKYVFDSSQSPQTSATAFGSAIHAGLAVFYSSERSSRNKEAVIDAFVSSARVQGVAIPEKGDARSIDIGIKILTNYFDKFNDEPWETYKDDRGFFVEREFEVSVHDDLVLFGTIDAILINPENNKIAVVDHKTARSINDIPLRVKPNHQITGYMYAANKMGIGITTGMLTGLQVAKTLQNVVRTETQRTEEDFMEWVDWVNFTVSKWNDSIITDNYPMAGNSQCSTYGGCKFRYVCAAPISFRKTMLNAMVVSSEEGEE